MRLAPRLVPATILLAACAHRGSMLSEAEVADVVRAHAARVRDACWAHYTDAAEIPFHFVRQ
jgi:hypothetical protein